MTSFTTGKVAAALLLAAASAASQAADVTIYGRAHLSLDQLDNGHDSGTNVSSNASRLGFRASSKLDDGLEAFVQLEQTIRFDEGSGQFADRDSYVGLRGNFGTLKIGQFDTPLKAIRSKVDQFGDRIGDIRNLTRINTGGSNIGNVFDERFKNGVAYESPKFSNISWAFHYTPHNTTGPTTDNVRESYSTSLTYEVKGLYLAAAYESFEGVSGIDPKAIRLGAYYDIGAQLRLSALYQNASDIPGGDRDVYGIGASYKLDKYVLRGQLYQVSDNDSPDTGATLAVIGIDRNLGKDLTLYAAYGITSNDDAALYSVSGGGRGKAVPAIAGEDNTGLSLGIVYSF